MIKRDIVINKIADEIFSRCGFQLMMISHHQLIFGDDDDDEDLASY